MPATIRMTPAQARAFNKLTGKQVGVIMRSKYRAVRTTIDGHSFPSKKEAARYAELQILQREGSVRFFACQPAFYLPGGIKYKADFMVAWTDGRVTVEDPKSEPTKTPVYKLKKRLMAERFPEVEILEL